MRSFRPLNLLAGIVIVFSVAGAAGAQSLGEIARKEQAKKAATPRADKVITNDDVNTFRRDSEEPAAAARGARQEPSDADSDAAATTPPSKDGAEAKPEAGEEKSPAAALQARIEDQKKKVDLLERELDLLQREQKLRATTYYADAGNRLRDSKRYAEEQKKLTDDSEQKKKALDDAKAEMEKMKEDARKLGLRIS